MTQLTLTFLLRTQQKTFSPGSLIIDKGQKISHSFLIKGPLTLRVIIYNCFMNSISVRQWHVTSSHAPSSRHREKQKHLFKKKVLAGTVGAEYHRGTARKAREGMEEFNDPVLMLCSVQISECIHLPSETLKCLWTPKSIALDSIGIILYFKWFELRLTAFALGKSIC